MFKPSATKPLVYGVPRIYVTVRALEDMWAFVDEVSTEVGWMGTASRLSAGPFLIEDVFLVKQECHGATTEMDPEGINALNDQLIAADDLAGIPLDSPDFRVNKLNFWGH